MPKKLEDKTIKKLVIQYSDGTESVFNDQRAFILMTHEIDVKYYGENQDEIKDADVNNKGYCYVFGENDDDIGFAFSILLDALIESIGVGSVSDLYMKAVAPILMSHQGAEYKEEILEKVMEEKSDVIN